MKNMRSKNRPKYYEAGGLLEMLTESSPTMLFEQRTKDRVARDLLRNEVEKPPRIQPPHRALAHLHRVLPPRRAVARVSSYRLADLVTPRLLPAAQAASLA